jgi:predicted cupin superfamily sugar epimerase
MASVDDIVAALGLEPHAEGGFYRETFRSERLVATPRGARAAATAILFLVTAERPSLFHRLRSDELWLYHSGAPLEVVSLLPDGSSERVVLAGADALTAGLEVSPQAIVPREAWQAARVVVGGGTSQGRWTLVSCVVTPGFDYADFEVGERRELTRAYPQESKVITALTVASPGTPTFGR